MGRATAKPLPPAKPSRRKIAVGALVLGLFVALVVVRARLGADKWSCAIDDSVPAADREAAGRSALNYVQTALGSDPAAAYGLFASGGPPGLTREQFVTMAAMDKQRIGLPQDLRVAHTYFTTATGGRDERAICGHASQPDDWVAVQTKPGAGQAHVVVEGKGLHNAFVFVIALAPEAGQWRVQHAFIGPSGYMGKSAEEFEGMAAAEERALHGLNAYMLYVEALALANRGPSFQLGILPRIKGEIANVKLSGPLAGQSPFKWDSAGAHFEILSADPIGLSDKSGDKLYLVVHHEIDPWVDDASAERKNRQLIAAFAETYPEYKQAFGGLVIKGQEKEGSRIWGTIADND